MYDAEAPPGQGRIVVGFAGGGGSSVGVRLALGRDPDLAMNHWDVAIRAHGAHFPDTDHIQTDIFELDPRTWRPGEAVDFAWFSPDCTDFSKAKGKAPRSERIRGLAWSIIPWALFRRPSIIMVENVEEFVQWGPVHRAGPHAGEPIPERRGETFARWRRRLERLGYVVEWKLRRAADFDTPTTRLRLLIIARCDGAPIVWPDPTNAPRDRAAKLGLRPWRGACECIDFSRPCPSIFMTQAEAKSAGLKVKRPLVAATMGRVARGVERYVIATADPFLIDITNGVWGRDRAHDVREPVKTLTASRGGEVALVSPALVGVAHGEFSERAGHRGRDLRDPVHTISAGGGDAALMGAFLAPRYGERDGQAPRALDIAEPYPTVVPDGNGGGLAAVHLQRQFGHSVGSGLEDPMGAVMPGGGGKTAAVAAYLGRQFGSTVSGRSLEDPHPTVMTEGGGGKSQLVAAFMAPGNFERDGRPAHDPLTTLTGRATQQQLVAAHLGSYYETGTGSDLAEPVRTATTKDRHALTAAWMLQANTGMVGHDLRAPASTIVGAGSTQQLVEARLAVEGGEVGRRGQVLDFLWAHFGAPTPEEWGEPAATLAGRLKFGLVILDGQTWMIVDIGLRMLMPDELAAAMGFPADYRLGVDAHGKAVSKVQQTEMIGNAVPPKWAAAHIAANAPHLMAPGWRYVA